METIYSYESASKAVNELKDKGYSTDFNTEFKHIEVDKDDFTIDYLYRYDGMTDPADESSVYGLRNNKTGLKGIFVAGNLSTIEGSKRDIILELEVRCRRKDDSKD